MDREHLTRAVRRTVSEICLEARSMRPGKLIHLAASMSKYFLLGYPYNVSIEPINACNLDCEFCSAPPKLIERETRAMDLAEFKKIVDDVAPLTHYLWLFFAGEPFMNNDLNRMIAYADRKNMHTTTSTNAMLLNREKIIEMVASGLDHLIVSLDGATKESYEKMRKGARFEKTIENIGLIAEEKKKQGKAKPIVELQFLVSKINEHEVSEFKKLARELGADRTSLKSIALPEWIHGKENVKAIEEKYLPETGLSRYREKQEEGEKEDCKFSDRCMILVDGNVCMCCYDIKGEYCFGNALNENFLSIWNSKKYRDARKKIAKRQYPLCKKCGIADAKHERITSPGNMP